MNKPNPFEIQPSAAEQLKKSRARLRLAVFGALGVSILVLVPLLVQGCKRDEGPVQTPVDTNAVTAVDTNLPPLEPVNSNPLVPLPVTNLPPIVPPPLNVPAGTEYTVAKGDSFYTIGKKFGVSIKAISDANPGVDSKKLNVGQKLNVPAGAAPAVGGGGALPAEPVAAGATYAVKSGDTLTRIAASHGTTVKAIKSANSLTTDKIKVGQKLKIPVKEAAPAAPAAAPLIEAAPSAAPAMPALPTLPPPTSPTKQ